MGARRQLEVPFKARRLEGGARGRSLGMMDEPSIMEKEKIYPRV
jgi:hypothetical protein